LDGASAATPVIAVLILTILRDNSRKQKARDASFRLETR
jgi:hypothetical protein